jgi:hypothetical protein
MRERPIPFSGPMVRAILAGTKTQTRRLVKPQPSITSGSLLHWRGAAVMAGHDTARSPYGQPGDRLWVREAWRTVKEADDTPPRDMDAAYRLWYEADAHADHHAHQLGYGRYRPPMFMPRWASRITLEVTGVRVERLADISEADAQAEGIERRGSGWAWYSDRKAYTMQPIVSYRDLWESINGPGSWDANPWVWVVEFKRIEGET